jgi:hypothetical protein
VIWLPDEGAAGIGRGTRVGAADHRLLRISPATGGSTISPIKNPDNRSIATKYTDAAVTSAVPTIRPVSPNVTLDDRRRAPALLHVGAATLVESADISEIAGTAEPTRTGTTPLDPEGTH